MEVGPNKLALRELERLRYLRRAIGAHSGRACTGARQTARCSIKSTCDEPSPCRSFCEFINVYIPTFPGSKSLHPPPHRTRVVRFCCPLEVPPPHSQSRARRAARRAMPKLKAGWWSPEEEQSLLEGHAKHTATGSLSLWADILGDSSLFFAIGRTNVDLKDKWRTLRKRVVPSAADPKRLELQVVGGEPKQEKSRADKAKAAPDRVKAIFAPPAPPAALPLNQLRAAPPRDHDMRAPPKKRARALSTPQEAPSECSKCSAASGSVIGGTCTSYCPRTRCLVEVCA